MANENELHVTFTNSNKLDQIFGFFIAKFSVVFGGSSCLFHKLNKKLFIIKL